MKPHRKIQASYAVLLMFCLVAWWGYSRNIDLAVALYGFSPLDWINHLSFPENFTKDFPGGVENYRSSAFMYVYPLSYHYLGIEPVTLQHCIILIEILALACAVFYLCRSIKPEANILVPFMVVLTVISGHAGDLNLARFETTFYRGLFYNIADALRITAVAFYLNKKHIASFICIAFSFITHIVIGFTGIIFLAAMFLASPREIPKRQVIVGLLIFSVISVGWLIRSIDISGIAGGGIPTPTWLALTKLNNYHWYPVDYGTFTFNHQERFISFLSFLVLLSFYFNPFPIKPGMKLKIASGLLAMFGLVIFGIIASTGSAPVLIKLALHRANDMIIIIGLVYIVDGLFRELDSDSKYRWVVSLFILISPFLIKPAYPLAYSLLLTVPPVSMTIKSRMVDAHARLILSFIALSILWLLYYFAAGIAKPWNTNAYTGFESYRQVGIGFLIMTGVAIVRLRSLLFSQYVIVFAMLLLSINWIFHQEMRSEERHLARSYLEAQLWAKAHTPHDALFMVDPTIYYGWRDYSQRSSFGNLRDWLHNPCHYHSDVSLYHKGIQRFEDFGIPLQPFLNKRPPLKGFDELDREVRKKYYSTDDRWRRNMAERYDIAYFIMQKKEMLQPSALHIAYENDHFLILKPE